ncbi:AAA family ATPase [Stappia sp.]|uniref:AAA family ATPase n=1 Tax=Stappia sp. TaxID=1870903 RepID=UPI003D1143F3
MTDTARPAPPVLRSVAEAVAFLHARLHGAGLLVAGICGPAGAGKTTLCTALAGAAPFPLVRLDCDAFSRHGRADRQAHIAEAVASGISRAMAARRTLSCG